MAKKTGLGRGLDALIPGGERPAMEGVSEILVDLILPNPRQPRAHIDSDSDEMKELSASIREHGVIQPLIVTRSERPGGYMLVAGERRLLAARQAGLERVPVIVREASDQQRLELALIENVQRADLSPLETAEAYRQLTEDFNLSHEQIAHRVGKSRTAVTNTLRLLVLPQAVKEALAEGRISEGHGRALLYLSDPGAQATTLRVVEELGLNVRQTENLARSAQRHSLRLLDLAPQVQKALVGESITAEHALVLLDLPTHPAQEAALQSILSRKLDLEATKSFVRQLLGEKAPRREIPPPSPEIIDLEERLRESLGGFRVDLRYRPAKGGTITIRYDSDEDLNTIVSRILGEE